MQPENVESESRLLKSTSILPHELELAVRRFIVDKATGNVQLNIRDGKILGFHENRMHSLPQR